LAAAAPNGIETEIVKTLIGWWRSYRINILKGFICLLPFVVFYWLLPFYGTMTIGNDYPQYSLTQQMELHYSLVHRSFPLYAPGFAGGRSAAALTLGGLYHPLSHLAAHSPGYWNGNALEWNTFWRLISLGLTQLVLFNLLEKLELSTDLAFILSFITTYNMRTLDMFRYGASLENYLGFLLLFAAMANLYISPGRALRPLAIIGATYLMICGGHPQIAYLGLLGAGILCLAIPSALSILRSDLAANWPSSFRYHRSVAGYVTLGLLLAMPYLLSFYFEFLRDAPERIGQSYFMSLVFSDHWGGALNSFFNPLRSDVHGAFGSSSLILLAVVAPPIAFAMRRNKVRTILIALWLTSILVVLCSIGCDTPIHYWFWKIVPFANSFRTPGRIGVWLPPIFMLLLAWFFRAADDDAMRINDSPIELWQVALIALLLFLVGYFLLANPTTGWYTPFAISPYPSWINLLIFGIGTASLLLLVLRVTRWRFRLLAGVALSVLVMTQAIVQFRYGTWREPRTPTPGLKQMDDEKRIDLAFRGSVGYGMESALTAHSSTGFRHRKKPDDEYPRIGPLAVFRPEKTDRSFAAADEPASPQDVFVPGQPVATVYAAFNRLTFHVESNAPGFLALSVPYSPQWHVSSQSHEYPVSQTDRHELAVLLPAGAHDVDFRFRSIASTAGMLISCGTGLFIAIFFSRARHLSWASSARVGIAVILLAAGFALWQYSLYNGENLGTQYKWTGVRL
jgi:hypothetical protein